MFPRKFRYRTLKTIELTGEVKKSWRLILFNKEITILDIINRAGGYTMRVPLQGGVF